MGRVIPFRAPETRRAPRPRRARQPWDVQLVISNGAMRTAGGFARCQGKILIRWLDDGRWQMTYSPAERAVSTVVDGDDGMTADEAMGLMLHGMFEARPEGRKLV